MRPCGSAQIQLFVDQSFQKCTKRKKIKFENKPDRFSAPRFNQVINE